MEDNHGKVGECLYIRFTVDKFKEQAGNRIVSEIGEVQDGDVYDIDYLNNLGGISTSVPIHIDNDTQGNYEAVCEFGVEVH